MLTHFENSWAVSKAFSEVHALDQPEAALGRYDFRNLAGIAGGSGEGQHDVGGGKAGRLQLRRERLAMVDDLVCAEVAHPRLCLRTRGGGDDGEARELARELDGDGADAARAADDQERAAVHPLAALHADPIEQQLPGGERGERQRRSLEEGKRLRLVANYALVDQVEGCVGAGPIDVAGVIDLVARLEQRQSRPTASTVPAASHPRMTGSASVPCLRLRTLKSTGLTETAATRTSRS
jgi:hypothetical protein